MQIAGTQIRTGWMTLVLVAVSGCGGQSSPPPKPVAAASTAPTGAPTPPPGAPTGTAGAGAGHSGRGKAAGHKARGAGQPPLGVPTPPPVPGPKVPVPKLPGLLAIDASGPNRHHVRLKAGQPLLVLNQTTVPVMLIVAGTGQRQIVPPGPPMPVLPPGHRHGYTVIVGGHRVHVTVG